MRTTDSELDIPRRILTGTGLFAARARAERAGAISLGQTAVLRQLQKAGAITPGAVADRLLTQPQSLSGRCAALEEQGWIRRRPDPDDGRQSLLEITPAGTEVLAAEMRPREIWLAGALEQLTDAERDLLVIAAGSAGTALRGQAMTTATLTTDTTTDQTPVRRVARLFRPYRWSIVVLLAVSVAQGAAGVASPFLVRDIVDEALPQRSASLVVLLAGGMIVAAAIAAVLGVVTTRLSNVIGQGVMHDLRVGVYDHLQRMSLGFFTQTRAGELQSRIANDIGGVDNVVTDTASSVVQNGVAALAVAVAALVMNSEARGRLPGRHPDVPRLLLPDRTAAAPDRPRPAEAARRDHRAGRRVPLRRRRPAGEDPRPPARAVGPVRHQSRALARPS